MREGEGGVARACVHVGACVRACVRACVHVGACVRFCAYLCVCRGICMFLCMCVQVRVSTCFSVLSCVFQPSSLSECLCADLCVNVRACDFAWA